MGAVRVGKKRREGALGKGTLKSRKVVVNFTESFYQETASVAAEVATSYNDFIRLAVEHYLSDLRQRKLEKELAEGYIANAALSRQITEEFRHADSDLV